MRLLVLTNIPSPYQVDLLDAVSGFRGDLELHAMFCAASEQDRQFDVPDRFPFAATMLQSRRFPGTPKDWHWPSGLPHALEALLPIDVAVLSGSYTMPAVLAARRWLTRRRVPWLYWGETPEKRRSTRTWRSLRTTYLEWFLRPAAGVLGIGVRATAAYRSIVDGCRRSTNPGAAEPTDQVSGNMLVFNIPYAPRLDPLLDPPSTLRVHAERLRRQWKTPDPIVALFSGSLQRRKAPDVLVNAMALAADAVPRLRVHFVGDGPMRRYLETQVAARGLANRVRFDGFLRGDNLWAAYLGADVFVLPTRGHEGWGVVVGEAMAAGLPAVVTDRVGCADDLIEPAATGFRVAVDDPAALAKKLVELADDDQRRRRIGAAAREAARRVNAQAVAARMVSALKSVSSRPTGSPTTQAATDRDGNQDPVHAA